VQQTQGILVLSVEDYLKYYWQALSDVHSLLQSLMASIQSSKEAGGSLAFANHLTKDELLLKLKEVRIE